MKYNNSVKRNLIYLITAEMIRQGGKASESKETVLKFLGRDNKFSSK